MSMNLNPKNKGKFTATKHKTHKSTSQLLHSKNPLTRRRANFARMAKRHFKKLEEGGFLFPDPKYDNGGVLPQFNLGRLDAENSGPVLRGGPTANGPVAYGAPRKRYFADGGSLDNSVAMMLDQQQQQQQPAPTNNVSPIQAPYRRSLTKKRRYDNGGPLDVPNYIAGYHAMTDQNARDLFNRASWTQNATPAQMQDSVRTRGWLAYPGGNTANRLGKFFAPDINSALNSTAPITPAPAGGQFIGSTWNPITGKTTPNGDRGYFKALGGRLPILQNGSEILNGAQPLSLPGSTSSYNYNPDALAPMRPNNTEMLKGLGALQIPGLTAPLNQNVDSSTLAPMNTDSSVDASSNTGGSGIIGSILSLASGAGNAIINPTLEKNNLAQQNLYSNAQQGMRSVNANQMAVKGANQGLGQNWNKGGIAMALGVLGQMGKARKQADLFNQGIQKEQFNNDRQTALSRLDQAPSYAPVARQGGFIAYKGASHEQGGILVDKQGNPVDLSNGKAIANVEGAGEGKGPGEVSWYNPETQDTYIFPYKDGTAETARPAQAIINKYDLTKGGLNLYNTDALVRAAVDKKMENLKEATEFAKNSGLTTKTTMDMTRRSGGSLTADKAKEILRDGTAQGHKLTSKQKKYFGWVAGGKKEQGGSLPSHLNQYETYLPHENEFEGGGYLEQLESYVPHRNYGSGGYLGQLEKYISHNIEPYQHFTGGGYLNELETYLPHSRFGSGGYLGQLERYIPHQEGGGYLAELEKYIPHGTNGNYRRDDDNLNWRIWQENNPGNPFGHVMADGGNLLEALKDTQVPVQPNGLDKKMIMQGDGVNIFSVDGNYIRHNEDGKIRGGKDFVVGGNNGRYKFIPKNEVWIDEPYGNDTQDPEELVARNAAIIHELNERDKILHHGEGYEKAHQNSNVVEQKYEGQEGYKEGGWIAPYKWDEGFYKEFRKGGKLSDIRKRPGGSNAGKYKGVHSFAGPSGGAPKGSYPINTLKRGKAALAYAHNAPNPAGIRAAVYRKYPQLKHEEGGYLNYAMGGDPEGPTTPIDSLAWKKVRAANEERFQDIMASLNQPLPPTDPKAFYPGTDGNYNSKFNLTLMQPSDKTMVALMNQRTPEITPLDVPHKNTIISPTTTVGTGRSTQRTKLQQAIGEASTPWLLTPKTAGISPIDTTKLEWQQKTHPGYQSTINPKDYTPWLSPLGEGLSAVGSLAGYLAMKKARPISINPRMAQPEQISLAKERLTAIRDAANARAINSGDSRSLNAGVGYANRAAANTGVNRLLADTLGKSYMTEENTNAQMRQQAGMFNAQNQNQADIYNAQMQNAYRQRLAEMNPYSSTARAAAAYFANNAAYQQGYQAMNLYAPDATVARPINQNFSNWLLGQGPKLNFRGNGI